MSEGYLDTSILDKAICFAVNAHKNVERRGKNLPYIVHPMEACAIVATMTNDIDLLAASILHDVVEDTDYTIDDIEKNFGKRIANIVECETYENSLNSNKVDSWKERKRITIDKIKNANIDVKIVALGDKLSNARTMLYDYKMIGEKLWDRFHSANPLDHKWYYKELVNSLCELKDKEPYKEFVKIVSELFDKYY